MKVLIPTRNRPESLGAVLRFIERFYPGTSMIIADGSRVDMRSRVEAVCAGVRQLKVDYRPYPEELSYCDRMFEVLKGEGDEFIITGADDDFPLLDTLFQGEEHIRANPDCGIVIGSLLLIDVSSSSEMTATFRSVRSISHEAPLQRVRDYAAWPFPLSYALCRRDLLVERYRKTRDCSVGEFFDLLSGLYDCLHYKVHAVPGVSVVFTHNARHSYPRVRSKLSYFDHGQEIASLTRALARELSDVAAMPVDKAEAYASNWAALHLGSYMVGLPYHQHPNFTGRAIVSRPATIAQYDMFDRMFEDGTPERAQYREKLLFISAALAESAE